MKKKKEPVTSLTRNLSEWGTSKIGLTQLLKETGAEYWKMRNKKLKRVV